MALVFDILEDERRRLLQLKERYEREIAELPKGSLSRKRRWNKEYVYLAYRDSNKVKFYYVGSSDSDAVIAVRNKIEQRKSLEEKLRRVKESIGEVERGLRGQR